MWRVLRRALPKRYRERWGEELLQTHVDAAGGIGGTRGVTFWAGVARDVIATSFGVRTDMWRSWRRTARARRSGGFAASSEMALRELRRHPGFAVTAALTLGLGITASITMYSVLDRLLFSPPAQLTDAGSLRTFYLHGISPFTKKDSYSSTFAYPDIVALKQSKAFSAFSAYSYVRSLTLGKSESSERVQSLLADANYFATLGVKPAAGRFYTEQEDAIGAKDQVAVLSFELWMRRYGGQRDVIGRAVAIGKSEYRIIGVAPRGFTGDGVAPVDVWLPLHTAAAIEQGTSWEHADSWYWVSAVARLKPDATDIVAGEQATALYHAARADDPKTDDHARIIMSSIIPGRGPDPGSETLVAKMLGVVALLVLLMTCANAGNLFLARGVQRRRPLAVQSALGVSRSGLVWQLFLEALMIAAGAGIFAFGMLRVTAPVLFKVLLPKTAPPELDSAHIALVTFGFALVSAALAGLLTALRSSRVAPFEALRAGRSTIQTSSLRRSLLGVQAGLAVVLLLGAGLFLRSLQRAASVDLGVSLDAIAIDFEMDNGVGPYDTEIGPIVYDAAAALRRHPDVEHAAVTSTAPFNGRWGLIVDLPGADSIIAGPGGPYFYAAGPDYFETLGMHILQGRGFNSDDDRAGVRVAVVNDAMARAVWGGRGAIGQCLLVVREPRVEPPCTKVVGVVNDYRDDIDEPDAAQSYYLPPHHPDLRAASANYLMVRLRPGAKAGPAELMAAVRASTPGVRLVQVKTLRSMIASQLQSWQLGAALLTIFGILALIVAGAGLYSMVAFEVSQRRFELGVRSVLGATARRMIGALLTDVLQTTVLGVLVGLLASIALGRLAASLLFGVKPTDPTVYVGVVLVLICAGLVSVALPAWRITRIDPRTAIAED
jgi:predicted permease